MTSYPGSTASMGTGAPATLANGSTYYQLSGGQVVAVWLGAGGAPVKIMDVLTGGAITPLFAWSNLTAYGANAIVSANGSSYIAVAPSTGIDPTTDDGTHWMLLAAKGATGAQGPPGSATTDGAVLSRHLADLIRPAEAGWMIGAGFAQNGRRDDYAATAAAATRQIMSSGGLVLPGGRAVSALRMIATTAITNPLHQFVILYNARTLARLAVGTDVTTQPMTAGADVSFPIAYTPAAGIEVLAAYYCEVNTGGVLPAFAAKSSATAGTPTPRFGGLHDTLTAGSGPAAAPDPLAAASGGRGPFWVQAE